VVKKKRNEDWEPVGPLDETEYVAFCMVLMLSVVLPALDRGEAYSVVMQWLLDGITEETAIHYGDMLSKLTYQPEGEDTVH
jgi:hypothetical protein